MMSTLGPIEKAENWKNKFREILTPHVEKLEFNVDAGAEKIELTSSWPYLLAVLKGIVSFPERYGFASAKEAAIPNFEEDSHHGEVWCGKYTFSTEALTNFFQAISNLPQAKIPEKDWFEKNPISSLLTNYNREEEEPGATSGTSPWTAYRGSSPRKS